jgi:2,4-didehydro-3-deoxy-L-rhamnonate hydrolase
MKFLRIEEPGNEVAAVVFGGQYHDLRPITADINGDFKDCRPWSLPC